MGLWDKIKGELIDIIEWTQPSQSDVLAYRFPRYQNEIKNGAKLTVREGQVAILVNEGQLADVYPPGLHTLETNNMPILSTLMGWKHGFHSPFKAEVYFLSMRQWTDQKWGTASPIMLRDPEFGPVRIRAFGNYTFQISDPVVFLRQLVSTDPSFETYEIANQLRNTIVARFIDAIGQAKLPVLDMAGNYDKVAQVALEKIRPDLEQMGLKLTAFFIENISLPPEVEQALDTRTKMGVLGDMGQFTRYQTAASIPEAAKNPGGFGGVGAQIAAGVAIGQQAAGAIGSATQPGATPPPLPQAAGFFIALGGQQAGPFDLAALAHHVKEGSLTRTTLVWRQGLPAWSPAETVPELQNLFASVPPPLPPK
jgi:membrane protease subunit (stomatin/prohibitin family)